MDNDKNLDFEDAAEDREGEGDLDSAPRARNRTVMLTPEITGQVRARLAKELDPASSSAESAGVPDAGRSGGFVSMSRRGTSESLPEVRGATDRVGTVESRTSENRTRMNNSTMGAAAMGHQPRESAPDVSGRGRVVGEGPAAQSLRRSPQESEAALPAGDVIEWRKLAPIVGFLVSFDKDPNGEVYPLRSGRLIVTSETPSGGNFLFLTEESVSSMHAIVRISESGEIQVLDQLSESGTTIKKAGGEEVRLSGEKGMVAHGDEVSFGERKFQVCLLATTGRV